MAEVFNRVPVAVSRELLKALQKGVEAADKAGLSEPSVDYVIGFAHALSLSGVISSSDWWEVTEWAGLYSRLHALPKRDGLSGGA